MHVYEGFDHTSAHGLQQASYMEHAPHLSLRSSWGTAGLAACPTSAAHALRKSLWLTWPDRLTLWLTSHWVYVPALTVCTQEELRDQERIQMLREAERLKEDELQQVTGILFLGQAARGTRVQDRLTT